MTALDSATYSRIASRGVSTSIPLQSRSRRRRRGFALPAWSSVTGLRPGSARTFVKRLGHERTLGVVVASIVLGASFLSVAPGGRGGAGGDTGGPSGDGSAPRLAVGGTFDDASSRGRIAEDYAEEPTTDQSGFVASLPESEPGTQSPLLLGATQPSTVEGPFLEDGTLLKPVAVDTSVPDGSSLMRSYKVKAGDTLAGIAGSFDVSTMTLWWANKSTLRAKDALVRGQELRIPPVSGLVVEVKATDTLAVLATKYAVSEDAIVEINRLKDRNLVVGQVLMLPGAKGAPIATPKPPRAKPPTSGGSSSGGGGGSVRPPKTYSGGNLAWPAPGGRISQYYHYGHYGLDIDGSTGDSIIAAGAGTVTFAGWKNNGGGYQVWIAHGSGLYTTYNHMSSVAVGSGQRVSRGQRVGRMGATGNVTGSHLHFEVWKGPIWNGGSRVNPLGYL